MATNKLWTACVPLNGLVLMAQCKSSKVELMRRLLADDSVWKSATVSLSTAPRWANKFFRRGLAIRAFNGNA